MSVTTRRHTYLGEYTALGFDNASDWSNLLGTYLTGRAVAGGEVAEGAPGKIDCNKECANLGFIERLNCIAACNAENAKGGVIDSITGPLKEKFVEPFKNILIIVIGIILLIVALALLTR